MRQTRKNVLDAILIALPKFKFNGWKAYEDTMMGSFYFCNDKKDCTFYATPFWENVRGIPVEDFESNIYAKLPFKLSGSTPVDVKTYFTLIKKHIKEKYHATNKKRN